MRSLPPVSVSSADLDVALVADGIAAAWSPGFVRVENRSRWKLQCSLGADLHTLSPWTADVWPVRAATTMHVHPIGADPMVPGQPTGTLFVDVAEAFEAVPGTYPQALAVQPSAAQVPPAQAVASGLGSFAVPQGTVCVGWAVTGSGSGTPSLSITGAQSLAIYVSVGAAVLLSTGGGFPPGVLDIFPLDPADTSLTVNWNPTGNLQLFMWTLSLPGAVFVSNRPGQTVRTTPGGLPIAPNLTWIRFVGPFPTTQATAQLVRAGVAGQTIYLFSLSAAWSGVVAGTSLHLVDAPVGNPAGGTIVGDLSSEVAAPPPIGSATGAPITPGNSLYVWQDNATITPRGTLIIGQG